ncbi:MAG: hypothetical protein QOJ90_739 [Actinomycetota bacterium]|jgi:hypothetical protein|nr:hypothetical protein [Actinomycetota bacterium]
MVRRALTVLPVVAALLAGGCGGADEDAKGSKSTKPTAAPSSPTPSVPAGATIEPVLTRALPSDADVGLTRDKKWDASTGVRGITIPTVFHCRTGTPSDALRIARSSRTWYTPGWVSGKGPVVQMVLELVDYRDGGAKMAVAEVAAVPTTCKKGIDESGASRLNDTPPADFAQATSADAGVLAELDQPGGGTLYEVTAALRQDDVLGLLVVRGYNTDVVVRATKAAALVAAKAVRIAATGMESPPTAATTTTTATGATTA